MRGCWKTPTLRSPVEHPTVGRKTAGGRDLVGRPVVQRILTANCACTFGDFQSDGVRADFRAIAWNTGAVGFIAPLGVTGGLPPAPRTCTPLVQPVADSSGFTRSPGQP